MRSGTPSQRRPPAEWRFYREGEFWTIAYEGRVVRLKHTKGMHYLAQLLRHPGRRLYYSVSQLRLRFSTCSTSSVPI